MVMQACKVNLPLSHLSSPSEITSLLFEPLSHSLALILSSSSILLFPSFSFSLSSSPPPLSIPPFSTSSCFIRLSPSPDDHRIVFVVAGPSRGSFNKVLLRFWILHKGGNVFVRPIVRCTQRDLVVSSDRIGDVVVDLNHGFVVKVVSCSSNVFVLHSVSSGRIWVFCVGEDDGVVGIKLIKCGVVECRVPIYSIMVSVGFLVLGEENGVRVFALRPLVKGRVRMKQRGVADGHIVGAEVNCVSDAKLRTIKLMQGPCVDGTLFVAFRSLDIQNQKSRGSILVSLKAVSVKALSQKKFLVLDSVGDLHILSICNNALGSEITGCMWCLDYSVKVQMLALYPDFSTRTQTVWISDGLHSVHIMSVAEMELSLDEKKIIESEEKLVHVSAIEGIFTSEKVHALVPLSTNAVLVMGQDSLPKKFLEQNIMTTFDAPKTYLHMRLPEVDWFIISYVFWSVAVICMFRLPGYYLFRSHEAFLFQHDSRIMSARVHQVTYAVWSASDECLMKLYSELPSLPFYHFWKHWIRSDFKFYIGIGSHLNCSFLPKNLYGNHGQEATRQVFHMHCTIKKYSIEHANVVAIGLL